MTMLEQINPLEIYDLLAFSIHEAYTSGNDETFKVEWKNLKKLKGGAWEKWVDSKNKFDEYITILGDKIEFINSSDGYYSKSDELVTHYFIVNGKGIWERNF